MYKIYYINELVFEKNKKLIIKTIKIIILIFLIIYIYFLLNKIKIIKINLFDSKNSNLVNQNKFTLSKYIKNKNEIILI